MIAVPEPIYPLCQEIPYQDPLPVFAIFAEQTGSIFLDSAQLRESCGRYSFIAVDPFFTLDHVESDPFESIRKQLECFPLVFHPDLPPFQGGAAGYFGYDLYCYLENIPAHKLDDMAFPELIIGFYDLVISFDHLSKRAWIFSSGYPLQEKQAREARAYERCEWLLKKIENISELPNFSNAVCEPIQSNFSRDEYQTAVQKVIELILAGDIFEANISQRFKTILPSGFSAFELYRRLRLINPAPFAAYLVWDNTIIASASPERFLKLTQGNIEARPIKGTRPRGKNEMDDQRFMQELLNSEKDHAENIMIVDLMRNDLSRVCEDGSVKVPQICGLESYATVHHLVSVITGTLQKKYQAIDLLRATFPGGSITGAPKIRAMEIIADIEPTKRGVYCGSVGYIGFNGDMDTSISIRTFAIKNNTVTFQAGGAIVADSDPFAEYEETIIKAHALKRALIDDFVDR